MANFQSIQQILTHLKPELVSKYHVRSLGLFGSVVRDDFGDILASGGTFEKLKITGYG